jgi:Flp pilus assembly protein CpaB
VARTATASASVAESRRNRGVLLIAAAFGILSATLVFAYLNSQGSEKSQPGAPSVGNVEGGGEMVVVMTRDIKVGEKITADMLTTRAIPASAVLPNHATKPEDVVGKVATGPIYTGEQVLNAKVTSFNEQNSLAFRVPDGMRALSLQVPHEAWIAAGLVQPGDRVDVIGITTLSKTDPLTGQEKPDVLSGVIAQDVEVLAVAQSIVRVVPNLDQRAKQASGATNTAGSPLGDGATYEKSISVTLALTPEAAAKVALIDALKDDVAQYRLIVRQKGDGTPIAGRVTWSLEDVFDTKKR